MKLQMGYVLPALLVVGLSFVPTQKVQATTCDYCEVTFHDCITGGSEAQKLLCFDNYTDCIERCSPPRGVAAQFVDKPAVKTNSGMPRPDHMTNAPSAP